MPLIRVPKGATMKQRQKIASQNTAIEIRAGTPRNQAIAIGRSSAGLSKKKRK